MFDPDEAFATVCKVDTPVRERVVLALELLVWLARHGDMSYTPEQREVRVDICEAVIRSDLDSYQSLLLRMKGPR